MSIKIGLLTSLMTISVGIFPLYSSVLFFDKSSSEKDRVLFDDDKIEERHREKTSPDRDRRTRINELNIREDKKETEVKVFPKNEKFRYHDFDACIPGQETVNSCNSIPDQTRCDDGTFPITRQILNEEGRVLRQYRYCPGDPPKFNIPEGQLIEEISIDIERFRSYPIQASFINSDPNEFSLRNGHTHLWATAETQTFNSDLSGSHVRIKAIPIQWNWNYGDGTTRNLDFSGEPAPNHTLRDETPTSHSYSETGTFKVGVTTLYRGEFSVDGGPWQTIAGQAAVPSNPIEIDVWRTEKELIANE